MKRKIRQDRKERIVLYFPQQPELGGISTSVTVTFLVSRFLVLLLDDDAPASPFPLESSMETDEFSSEDDAEEDVNEPDDDEDAA